MEWEKETAADIVMGAAAKVAEDMVNGSVASIQDMSRYHSMYKNMAMSLNSGAKNMRKHLLGKKWMSVANKKAIRKKIGQIRAISRVCRRLQGWCAAYINSSIGELKKMEMDEKLSEIISRIDTRGEEEPPQK